MIEFNATFIVAMLSFVLFIMIMNAIFYKPVLNIMRKREEYINSNYQEAKEFSQRAEEFNTQRNEKIKETQAKCRIDNPETLTSLFFNSSKESFKSAGDGE